MRLKRAAGIWKKKSCRHPFFLVFLHFLPSWVLCFSLCFPFDDCSFPTFSLLLLFPSSSAFASLHSPLFLFLFSLSLFCTLDLQSAQATSCLLPKMQVGAVSATAIAALNNSRMTGFTHLRDCLSHFPGQAAV